MVVMFVLTFVMNMNLVNVMIVKFANGSKVCTLHTTSISTGRRQTAPDGALLRAASVAGPGWL